MNPSHQPTLSAEQFQVLRQDARQIIKDLLAELKRDIEPGASATSKPATNRLRADGVLHIEQCVLEVLPNGMEIEQIAVTTKVAAKLLSCSTQTIWRLTASGKLKRLPFGNYSIEELRRFAMEESR